MKKTKLMSIIIVIAGLPLTACTYTEVVKPASTTMLNPIISTPSISLQKNPHSIADVRQHLAVSIITASYYCKNNQWPTSIAEIRQYQKKQKIPLPMKVSWGSFQDVNINKRLIIKSRSNNKTTTITSTHRPPFCSLKSIKANVSVDVE